MRLSRHHFFVGAVPAAGVLVLSAAAAFASPRSVLTLRDDFDRSRMTSSSPSVSSGSSVSSASSTSSPQSSVYAGEGGRATGTSFSLAEPSRFSMTQSYSLTAMSGPHGSASSGLYLNTLSYQVTPLMSAFVDVGFHTPLHSSMPGMESAEGLGSVVLPRMGLEYRPSDRLSFNFELVNGADAWKAWGGSPYSPYYGSSAWRTTRGSRIP
jgi:hypothetical protein